jgi:hypothetical protein
MDEELLNWVISVKAIKLGIKVQFILNSNSLNILYLGNVSNGTCDSKPRGVRIEKQAKDNPIKTQIIQQRLICASNTY